MQYSEKSKIQFTEFILNTEQIYKLIFNITAILLLKSFEYGIIIL